MYRPPQFEPIVRIGVRPDPAADGHPAAPRPRGSRRPHSAAKIEQVRALIEQTALTYGEIARRTGVSRASICRWTRDCRLQRHLLAPRATDTAPSAKASAKMLARLLGRRLYALTERCVAEMEAAPRVELDALERALELLKLAKFVSRPKPRRAGAKAKGAFLGVARLGLTDAERESLTADLRACRVRVERATPEGAALTEMEKELTSPRGGRAFRRRGRGSRRNREHARLLAKE